MNNDFYLALTLISLVLIAITGAGAINLEPLAKSGSKRQKHIYLLLHAILALWICVFSTGLQHLLGFTEGSTKEWLITIAIGFVIMASMSLGINAYRSKSKS